MKRIGAKHDPHFRVVVMDQRKPRDGRAIEEIGYYNPTTDPSTLSINADRAQYWLGTGAVPSDTVTSLLKRAGVIEGPAGAEETEAETEAETEPEAEPEGPPDSEEAPGE